MKFKKINKINKKLLGVVLISFGAGVLASIIFPCVGFLIGALFVGLGVLELYC